MIVVVIIAILVGILVPVIGGAIRRARDAEVRGEISQLDDAIAKFKLQYGIEPPSRIRIFPPGNAAAWNNDPQSRALIRQMWPQFNFDTSGGIDANNVYTELQNGAVNLDGAQCLVFFLGGIRDPDSGALAGFSKNPAQPFLSPSISSNRVGPFFEFKGGFDKSANRWTGRFVTETSAPNFPEYLDPLPGQRNPYLYFSSYEGTGYRTSSELPLHGMTDIYRQGTSNNGPPYKRNGHQIISPGADGAAVANPYGTGGAYDPENAETQLTGPRDPERDNITNFSGGRLAP